MQPTISNFPFLHLILSIQLSGALPINDFLFSPTSLPALSDESFRSSISAHVSSFLNTHKINIPQPKFQFFLFNSDSSHSAIEEAIWNLRSVFGLFPDQNESPKLDRVIVEQWEGGENFEFEDYHYGLLEETKLRTHSSKWEYFNQQIENMADLQGEPHIINQAIRIPEIKGRGDMVVVGIVLLFLMICFTLEITKRWKHRSNNLTFHRKCNTQYVIHTGKEKPFHRMPGKI